MHDHSGHVSPPLAKANGSVEATVECRVDLAMMRPQCVPNYELVGGGEDWQLGRVCAG